MFLEGVVERLGRLQRSSKNLVEVDTLGYPEVVVDDIGKRGGVDCVEAEVADTHCYNAGGVASNHTVERLEEFLCADIVVERREDELLHCGIVIVIDISRPNSEGLNLERVGEVACDDERRSEEEGVGFTGSD